MKISEIKFPSLRDITSSSEIEKLIEGLEEREIGEICGENIVLLNALKGKDELGEFIVCVFLLNSQNFYFITNHIVLTRKLEYMIEKCLFPVEAKIVYKNGRYYDFA